MAFLCVLQVKLFSVLTPEIRSGTSLSYTRKPKWAVGGKLRKRTKRTQHGEHAHCSFALLERTVQGPLVTGDRARSPRSSESAVPGAQFAAGEV